jgi:hypothetical protein
VNACVNGNVGSFAASCMIGIEFPESEWGSISLQCRIVTADP